MPYVASESLRRRLDGGKPLPINDAVAVLRDVARASRTPTSTASSTATSADNVLIAGGARRSPTSASQRRCRRHERSAEASHARRQLTGTPAYMAPEQVAADPNADHRIDIYSFGAMAYELLSGSPPFGGRPPHAVLSAHLTEQPAPLESRAPGIPPALAAIVMKCLAKNPADRPQTADELVRALERVDLSGDWDLPGTSAAKTSVSRRTIAIVAAAVIAVAAGGWAIWERFRDHGPTPDRDTVAVVPFRVASADPALHYLREGMLDLLAAKLTGEGGLRATDPRQMLDAWRKAGGTESLEPSRDVDLAIARRLGAGRLLLGDVVGTPDRIVITASLLGSARGDSITRLSVEGPPDSLAWLVDRLAARLLAETSVEGAGRSPSLTSTSLPALRAYLDGQSKIRRVMSWARRRTSSARSTPTRRSALAALGLRMASSWYGTRRSSSADSTSRGANGLDSASATDRCCSPWRGRGIRGADGAGAPRGSGAVPVRRAGPRRCLVPVRLTMSSTTAGCSTYPTLEERARVVPARVGDRLELRRRLPPRTSA
jgi:serine/threonine-protein kinase